jgi:hypothetical protein
MLGFFLYKVCDEINFSSKKQFTVKKRFKIILQNGCQLVVYFSVPFFEQILVSLQSCLAIYDCKLTLFFDSWFESEVA